MHPDPRPSWMGRLRAFFALPEADETLELRLAVPIAAGLIAFFVIAIGVPVWLAFTWGVPAMFGVWPYTLATCALLAVAGVILWVLLRRGHVRLSGTGMVVVLWVVLTFWLYYSTGLNDISVALYFIIALLLGLMWGIPGVVVSGIVTFAAIIGVYVFEVQGYVTPPLEPVDPFNLVVAVLVLGVGFALTVFVVRTIEDAFDRARSRERALDESYRELAARSEALAARSEALVARTEELAARNAELDAFAHTVAHDLKNPLTALIMMSSVLGKGQAQLSPDRQAYYLALMDQRLRAMARIVDSLLLLARVRSSADIDVETLSMASLVNRALDRLTAVMPPEARITLPETWPKALGYAPWVEEIWVNYLSNALKYGGSPPEIEVGAEYLSGGMCSLDGFHQRQGPCVRCWVRDHGPGIPLKDQARLFTPFERLHTGPIEGEGLGLSIVQRIAEKLGGVVGVESAPGEGSRFYFTLPAAPPSSDDRDPLGAGPRSSSSGL